jgi:hypothetical protein
MKERCYGSTYVGQVPFLVTQGRGKVRLRKR